MAEAFRHSPAISAAVSRQDSRTYPAGTRISDVLAGLETPEDVSGAAFEKWILPDYEGDAHSQTEA